MSSVHIKKNDMVYVLSGKDQGKTGKVLKVYRDKGRAVVEGVNYIQKHTRPNPQKNVKGGILPKEAPIHISNLMVVCKRCGKHARVGTSVTPDGRKARVCKNCNEIVDA
ncbi:MAG: 50S ribosomal protein L24 [Acidobacteriota bacterium]|jgi:large subunit ribosomal protein L24|nr:50S ribosomal protein L24 [Acidobacteriota bacterium]NLT32898.1 50S ribosomal protein L24 [Acidobacteriota bacterium]